MTAVSTFDYADRPTSLTVQRPGEPDLPIAAGAAYEPAGPLVALDLGNGLTEIRPATDRYFPSAISVEPTTPLAGASRLQWTYTTDNVGNILSIGDGLTPANDKSYTYQDHQYFLTGGTGPWGALGWSYDRIGNRLTETRDGITDTYAYTPNAGSGNTALLSTITLGLGGTRTYTYGPAGHLEQVTAPGNPITFLSAAAGRLTRLERPDGNARSDFLYDGRSFLTSARADSLSEIFTDGFEAGDGSCWTSSVGSDIGAGTADCSTDLNLTSVYSSEGTLHAVTHFSGPVEESTRYYLYFADRPVAQLDLPVGGSAEVTWLSVDHLGTPVLATDDAGVVLWDGGFEPFGADYSGASGAGVDLRFPGQWEDEVWTEASQGLQPRQNAFRWYFVRSSRYSRPDPLGLLPPSRESWNLFVYALSNPISVQDPLGLDALTDDPGIQDCMYCLFFRAGRGFRNVEEGMWVVCDGDSYACDLWPPTARQGNSQTVTTTASPRPPGACAIFHTHPRDKLGTPSDCRRPDCDIPVANRTRLPIYSIHPTGIWKYDPQTGLTTQEADNKWFKEPKERCKKPCEGLQ